ncbi:MAG: hypothetical protein AAGH15_20540 [Myxococcota bacterium]
MSPRLPLALAGCIATLVLPVASATAQTPDDDGIFLEEGDSDDPFAEEAPPGRAPAPAAPVTPPSPAAPAARPEPPPRVDPIPPPELELPEAVGVLRESGDAEREIQTAVRARPRTRVALAVGWALQQDGSTFAVAPDAGDASDSALTLGAEVGHGLFGRRLSVHAGLRVGFQVAAANEGSGVFAYGGGPTSEARIDAASRRTQLFDAHAAIRVHGRAFFLGLGARGGMRVHRYADALVVETPRGYTVPSVPNVERGTERLTSGLVLGIAQVGLLFGGVEARLEVGYGIPGLSVGLTLAVPLWRTS